MNKQIPLILLGLFGALLIHSSASAQYFEFGRVAPEEFKADSQLTERYPAKYLFETGEYFFGSDLELNLEYHARLLVLNEEGLDRSVHKIRINAAVGQNIRSINAGTHMLNKRGRSVMNPVDLDDIVTEELGDGMVEVTITLPEVEPGMIIEYSYIKTLGHPGNIEQWIIQRDIPVDYNRLRFLEDDYFRFSKRFMGMNYQTQSSRDRYFDFGEGNEYIWLTEDIPALPAPELLFDRENYRSRIDFQALKIEIPEAISEDLSLDWADIHTELKEEYYFGGQLVDNPAIQRVSERVAADESDTLEIIRTVHDFLQTRINRNGKQNALADLSAARLLSGEAGNSASVNLLYVRMLRDLGITADPILLSTRGNGYPDPGNADLGQFDHVAARIETGGEIFFTDATRPLNSLRYPPYEIMNREGLRYTENSVEWIPMNVPDQNGVSADISAKLDSNGTLLVQMDLRYSGYESVRLAETGRDSLALQFGVTKGEGLFASVDSVSVQAPLDGIPTARVFTDTLRLAQSELRSDSLIFDPGILFKQVKDPFETARQYLPVEYPYPFSYTANYLIALPEDFSIADLPDPVTLRLPDDKGKLILLAQDLGDRISYLWQFEINAPFFDSSELPLLNEFYKPLRDQQKILLTRD